MTERVSDLADRAAQQAVEGGAAVVDGENFLRVALQDLDER